MSVNDFLRAKAHEVPEPASKEFRAGAGVLFISAQSNVLFLKPPEKRFWSFAGGGLLPGESYILGAFREAKEETGVRPSCVLPLHFAANQNANGQFPFLTTLAYSDEEFEPKFNSEHNRFKWSSLLDLSMKRSNRFSAFTVHNSAAMTQLIEFTKNPSSINKSPYLIDDPIPPWH